MAPILTPTLGVFTNHTNLSERTLQSVPDFRVTSLVEHDWSQSELSQHLVQPAPGNFRLTPFVLVSIALSALSDVTLLLTGNITPYDRTMCFHVTHQIPISQCFLMSSDQVDKLFSEYTSLFGCSIHFSLGDLTVVLIVTGLTQGLVGVCVRMSL